MDASLIRIALLCVAAIPFTYYLVALFSAWPFLASKGKHAWGGRLYSSGQRPEASRRSGFRRLRELCQLLSQDYPKYEIVFCVGDHSARFCRSLKRQFLMFPSKTSVCYLVLGAKPRTTRWGSWRVSPRTRNTRSWSSTTATCARNRPPEYRFPPPTNPKIGQWPVSLQSPTRKLRCRS